MYPATKTRRLVAVFAATAVCTITIIVGALTPSSANHTVVSAKLLMKATGSVYTADDTVYMGVTPGSGAKSWSLKIVNTGQLPQQFKVNIQTDPTSDDYAAELYNGYKKVGTIHGYFTEPIAPGGSVVLTLKVTVLSGAPQGVYATQMNIRNPETNAIVDFGFAAASATYQTGTKRNDLFVKTGSQPFAGGSVPQAESATAIKVGNTATFTLRLKNDGTSPANAITLSSSSSGCAGNYSVVVKQGTKDVSTAVANGTYTTGTLNVGAKLEFKVQIKQLSAASCTSTYFNFIAAGPDGSISQTAHVLAAA